MGSTYLTCLLIAVCLSASVCFAEDVPVFIWGDLEYKSKSANPLERTTAAEFATALRSELVNNPLLVAFVEETLSVEDLSARDESGASLFPYLRSQLSDSLYLPAVQNPVDAITKIADTEKVQRVGVRDGALTEAVEADTEVLLVELNDAGAAETRAELLRRHDGLMSSALAGLRESHDVVAVYTARQPSWSSGEDVNRFRRHLMQAESPASAPVVSAIQLYNLTNLLLAVSNITVTSGTSTTALTIPAAGPTVAVQGQTVTVTVPDPVYRVTLTVSSSDDGYWALKEATVTPVSGGAEERYTAKSLYALDGFSFHCNQVVFAAPNGTYVLTLSHLQLQPFFAGNAAKFGEAFDCIGYFSVPIWSGIFVLTILLSIFFYGVASMMDIRTMDRFDDPKGKTITINAGE